MHDFETIEKSYFTIDFIFAGSITVYAISGVCTQKCASCDCINFLVIMKVSHHVSKASLGNSFVLILYKIIRAEAGILRFLTHDSFFHCVG